MHYRAGADSAYLNLSGNRSINNFRPGCLHCKLWIRTKPVEESWGGTESFQVPARLVAYGRTLSCTADEVNAVRISVGSHIL